MFLADVLPELGFDVTFFTNVDEAWSWLTQASNTVDCVILDLWMPPGRYGMAITKNGRLTGLAFYRELRESIVPSPPVVIQTNFELLEVPELLATLEGDERLSVLRKLVDLESLSRHVRAVMRSE